MAITSVFRQMLLLMWKNVLLQMRSWILTSIIVILPIGIAGLLVWLRTLVDDEINDTPITWPALQLHPYDDSLSISAPEGKNLTMYYWPDNAVTASIMTSAATFAGPLVSFIGRNDKSEMYDELYEQLWSESEYLGVVEFRADFPADDSTPEDLDIAIRLSHSPRYWFYEFIEDDSYWRTEDLYPPGGSATGPRAEESDSAALPPGYFEEGFLSIQAAVNLGLMVHLGGSFDPETEHLVANRMPYPPYRENLFVLIIAFIMPFMFVIAMISLTLLVVKQLVLEKERRLKESMKMMGLSPWIHNFTWFIHFFFIFLVVSLVMSFVLTTKIVKEGPIFGNSTFGGVFLIFFFYSIQTIAFCFFLSSIFTQATTAGVITGVVWFLTYFVYLFYNPGDPESFYSYFTLPITFFCCFIPNQAFCFAVECLANLEGRSVGVKFSSLWQARTYYDDLSVGFIFVSQCVSSVIYMILTWYIENAFPGKYGVPKPFYFFLMPSYWYHAETDFSGKDEKPEHRDEANFEEDPDLKPGIDIHNLHKEYSNGKKAVRGITTKMFEGQITAFLGHNGAGKTSTISMLTGLYAPTKGTAIINGCDIRKDLEGVRNSLGICPQHDVLYDNLTVKEHLLFFCSLKGLSPIEAKKETEKMLEDLNLVNKKDAKASSLSGGMKRKLSVGIAFCANSKVVLLDEPTSGMDPSARRITWDLIQKYRKGRTIILTTHYMDEADFLGDRIAIMSAGKLVCVGSSLFLKNRYGIGYHMITEKDANCKPEGVESFIKKYVPGVEMESSIGSELSFRLPTESVQNFAKMFEDLEKQKTSLGILSYGVSVTTLEEVFLRVGNLNEDEEANPTDDYSTASTKSTPPRKIRDEFSNIVPRVKQNKVEPKHSPGKSKRDAEDGNEVYDNAAFNMEEKSHHSDDKLTSDPEKNTTSFSTLQGFTEVKRNTGIVLFAQQFQALLLKRIINTWRSKALSIAQILVPVLFTLLSVLVITQFIPEIKDTDPATLALDAYDSTVTPYMDSVGGFGAHYVNAINEFSGKTSPVDVSGTSYNNVSEYISGRGSKNLDSYTLDYIIGASFETDGGDTTYTAWFNGQPIHASPLALQMVCNALLRSTGAASVPAVRVINHPLPRTLDEKRQAAEQGSFNGFAIAMYSVGVGMGFLLASFSNFLIKERAVKSKHIQMVSGVHITTYWASTFLWDFLNFLFTTLLLTLVLVIFRVDGWTGVYAGMYILLLILYAWGVLPFIYLVQHFFNVPANGFLVLALLNIIATIGWTITVFVLRQLNKSFDIVYIIGFFMPQYSIASAILDLSENHLRRGFAESLGLEVTPYFSFDYPGIGRYCIYLFIDGVLFFLLLFVYEMGIFSIVQSCCCFVCCWCKRIGKSKTVGDEADGGEELDADVLAEKHRLERPAQVNSDQPDGQGRAPDTLVIKGLSKSYRDSFGAVQVKAVKGIYVGIPAGECFGLLGVNGAGKSTTFNMLTGDLMMDEGVGYLEGINLRTQIVKARQRMGYCPQFDALIPNMTANETLCMYGRFRGVPEGKLKTVVKELMEAFQLTVYADKEVDTYSGGNKRKLSTAIALIGSPPIVFLDEPSSGMDPVTRRRLWNVVSRVREDGRSIIITSHSMEECEALCTRLAIMVNGQFKCLGSLQRLKSRFGDGFTLICKTRSDNENVNNAVLLKEFIENKYKGMFEIKDEHLNGLTGYLHYQLVGNKFTWSELFSTIEGAKSQFNICDYIISQTTLEQIFLNFARDQKPDARADEA